MKTRIYRRMDNFHVHLREDPMMADILPFTARSFKRAVAMGNTTSPIICASDVIRYRNKIMSYVDNDFEPIMSIMLVNKTTPEMVEDAFAAGARVLKLIPGGTSTNSEDGVPLDSLVKYYPVLEKWQSMNGIFSVHFELVFDPITKQEIPEIKREVRAIPYLLQLAKDFPNLRIVVEHASCREMIQAVKDLPKNVAATLTPHHATKTWFDCSIVNGKVINPLNYCKPIFKTEADRIAVAEAMVSGNPKFFLGTDSAAHLTMQKVPINNLWPKAGICNEIIAVSLLCRIFDWYRCPERLEDFTSRFGAEFYGLPLNEGSIILINKPWRAPREYRGIPIFMGEEQFNWQIAF